VSMVKMRAMVLRSSRTREGFSIAPPAFTMVLSRMSSVCISSSLFCLFSVVISLISLVLSIGMVILQAPVLFVLLWLVLLL
jgi:hypothetical protein